MNVTQTLLGSLAADFFSKEWKATIKIGGISLNPFSHVTLNNIVVIDPNNELVLKSEKIRCTFSQFPLQNGLKVKKVFLKDTEFNLKMNEEGMNLKFIIDYFKSDKPKKDKESKPFPIKVQDLTLQNVSFSLQLKDAEKEGLKGVNVKNMHFDSIYADIKNITNLKDSIHAVFKNFKAIEKSGFRVEQIAMEASVSRNGILVKEARVKTPYSDFSFDVSLKYNGWDKMKYFIDTVQMQLNLKQGSYGNMRDAGYWANTLWGMDEKAFVSGKFSGTIANMESDFFEITFGNQTQILGKGSIVGLPKIKSTHIKAKINKFTTTIDDLNSIQLPENMPNITIPNFLKEMGVVNLMADFEGTMQDFKALADIKSAVGDLHADLQMNYDEQIKDYRYEGKIETAQFNLNQVISNDWISNIDLNVTVTGSGTKLQNINSKMEGHWRNFNLRGNNYDSIYLSVEANQGKLKGFLDLEDDDISLSFSGLVDLSDSKTLKCDFKSDIKNAQLEKLNLFPFDDTSAFAKRFRDSNVVFSASIDADFKGNTIDEIIGTLNLTNVQYIENGKRLFIKELSFLSANENNKRNLTITSDLFDFSIDGYFKFADIAHVINHIMGDYCPQTFYKSSILHYSNYQYPQEFEYQLKLNNLQPALNIFAPSVSVSPNTTVTGMYSQQNDISLNLQSDSVVFGNILLHHLNINSKTENGYFQFIIKTDSLNALNNFYLKNITADIKTRNDVSLVDLSWNDSLAISLNKGKLNFTVYYEPFDIKASFNNSTMLVNGTQWVIEQNNLLTYSETSTSIKNLIFAAENQSISVNSEISKNETDELTMDFKNFNLSEFNIFLDGIGLHSSGLLNGSFHLKDFFKTPYFKSNLSIANLNINDEKLGDASIISSLDNANERINIDFNIISKGNKGTSKPISVQGYIYPQRKTNNYDLKIAFQQFKLKTIAGYMKSFASVFEGNLGGNLTVAGDFAAPKLNGEIDIQFGKIRINFLNTSYNFADKIAITENAFELKSFKLLDSLANSATITGKVTHQKFKDYSFDLALQTQGFMFMNTQASYTSMYYGSAVAAGSAKIKGALTNLAMDINVRTQKGTNIRIPISNKVQLAKNQFIQFVSKEKDTVRNISRPEPSNLNLKININLQATSDAEISVPINFSDMGGNLTASGNGDLRMVIDTKKGDFFMFGDYVISSGKFKLNVTELISRDFLLEKDGNISWSGNAVDANMNVAGIYTSKSVSLSPLYSGNGTENAESESYKKTVNVESIINFKGKLLNPNVTFDMRLPRADQETENLVFSAIKKDDESQMTLQTVFLLAFSQFFPVNGSNFSTNNVGASVAINAAMSQASSILGGLIPFVDVTAGFKAGDQDGTSDQYNFTVSKDFGRFYIYAGGNYETNKAPNSSSSETSSNSNFTGEFIGGFRFTKNFSFQTFNIPNTNTFTKDNAPYVQGVGVIYKRSFNKFADFFKRKNK